MGAGSLRRRPWRIFRVHRVRACGWEQDAWMRRLCACMQAGWMDAAHVRAAAVSARAMRPPGGSERENTRERPAGPGAPPVVGACARSAPPRRRPPQAHEHSGRPPPAPFNRAADGAPWGGRLWPTGRVGAAQEDACPRSDGVGRPSGRAQGGTAAGLAAAQGSRSCGRGGRGRQRSEAAWWVRRASRGRAGGGARVPAPCARSALGTRPAGARSVRRGGAAARTPSGRTAAGRAGERLHRTAASTLARPAWLDRRSAQRRRARGCWRT